MDKKRGIDLAIVCVCGAIGGIALFYIEEGSFRTAVLVVSGILAFVFFLLAIREGMEKGGDSSSFSKQSGPILELVLLSEEDTQLMAWDMYGKRVWSLGDLEKTVWQT